MERAVVTGLAKVPADRFATATDFAAALTRADRPAAAVRRGRRLRPWLAGTGLALALAVLVALFLQGWHPREAAPEPESPARVRSLAVLPLRNLSGDSTLGEAMTEALITDRPGRVAAGHFPLGRDAIPHRRHAHGRTGPCAGCGRRRRRWARARGRQPARGSPAHQRQDRLSALGRAVRGAPGSAFQPRGRGFPRTGIRARRPLEFLPEAQSGGAPDDEPAGLRRVSEGEGPPAHRD